MTTTTMTTMTTMTTRTTRTTMTTAVEGVGSDAVSGSALPLSNGDVPALVPARMLNEFTGVTGRGDEMTFTWPLWAIPASLPTTRSALQVDWTRSTRERAARGIFAICSPAIRRSVQGYGSFGPSSVIG
ncbi:MAG: hypothetical protein ACXW5U_21750 [Thermoanaerobaculia bacterium]